MSVELLRVSFTYPGADEPSLDDVSFSIAEGCFALVVGATGSGKSTLLRTMNGLVPHFTGGTFEGHVRVGGRNTLEHLPRDLSDVVAFVPQEPGRSFVLDRVEDELAYAMENLALEPQVMRRRVEETLDLLDIEVLRKRSVGSLSGGEKQRVAIAAALTAGPRVLLLDEPTSQLDPQGAEDVLAALHRLVHDLGLTVVAAEHRIERVASFADVVLTCSGGRVSVAQPEVALADAELGPPVARAGRALGWEPVPLTVRDARRRAREIRLPETVVPPEVERTERVVTVTGLHAGYGGDPVLRAVDLRLHRGEIVALMGRNGSGKTTLLRTITGVHASTSGTVEFEGRAPVPGRDIALLPQSSDSLLFSDTVSDEIDATIKARATNGASVSEMLDRFGLNAFVDRHPRDLSAGQRLLVALGAIAATGAPVLLLDEPTRGLDHAAKVALIAALRAHVGRGGTVMLATHDVELAAALATRVVMLASGEVIVDGDPATVFADSAVFSPQMTRVFGPGWLTPEQVVAAVP